MSKIANREDESIIYLLDTTAFSDLMRENSKVMGNMARVSASDKIVICAIVRGEVCYGLERLSRGKKQWRLAARAAELFAQIPCEPIPERAGDLYGRIKRESQLKGLPLDENDLWIAATTIALNAVLVTRDSDFQRVRNLKVEDWSR